MRIILLLAALIAWAGPAAASPEQSGEPVEFSVIESEMQDYGSWLMQLAEIQAPAQQSFAAISGEWQAAMNTGTPERAAARFRPVIAETVAVLDRADARLLALAHPEFNSLGLTPDLQPQAIARTVRRLNAGMREAIQGFDPLLEAMIRGDAAAAQAAGLQMMNSLSLVIKTQMLLARATLAATPREMTAWETVNVELLYYRAAARILGAWPRQGLSGTDTTLARDLLALAAELNASAERGETRLASEFATFSEARAEAERQGELSRAGILRRSVAILEAGRGMFPLARDLATILRREAASFEGGRVAMPDLTRAFVQFQPIRQRIDAIIRRENAAIAGAR